jgi:predicted ABC-type ATPase
LNVRKRLRRNGTSKSNRILGLTPSLRSIWCGTELHSARDDTKIPNRGIAVIDEYGQQSLEKMSEPLNNPTVYIIAGPNGAGKTTFATEFLPKHVRCNEFLNADLIAAGLSPFAPETQNLKAGRLLLARLNELARNRESFGFETTLSGRGYVHQLRELRAYGYRVCLFFLWLPDSETAVQRVALRVREGGHNIPEAEVRRRYPRWILNFFTLFLPLLDYWILYDASQLPPNRIAEHLEARTTVLQPALFQQIKEASCE